MSNRASPRAVARKQPPDTSDQSISAKLSRLVDRKRKGRTNGEIAEAAGLPPMKLTKLLNGHIDDPRFSTVLKLLKALPASLREYEEA